MTVQGIVDLINKLNTPDFGPKNWQNQPAYFEKILENVNTVEYGDSLYVELGVFTGFTLELINKGTDTRIVYGFDTFSGLPEDWTGPNGSMLYEKNAFSTTVPHDTDKNKFIVGRIEDTLETFL